MDCGGVGDVGSGGVGLRRYCHYRFHNASKGLTRMSSV